MALQVNDLKTMEMYLEGVLGRADHHAKTVGAVALALVGAVLWKKDAEPVKVRTYAGATANILWVRINGKRYALAYNHHKGCIELRERTQNGEVIYEFTNKTSVTQVARVFEQLKPSATDPQPHRAARG